MIFLLVVLGISVSSFLLFLRGAWMWSTSDMVTPHNAKRIISGMIIGFGVNVISVGYLIFRYFVWILS